MQARKKGKAPEVVPQEPAAQEAAQEAAQAAPKKQSKKKTAAQQQPAAPQEAPKEQKKSIRRVHTNESVQAEFADLIGKLQVEIDRRKADSSLGGIKIFRMVKKQLETIGKHVSHISHKRPSNRKGNANSGFLKPVQISKDMAQFAGWDSAQPRSRVDATKALCKYIKEHNLQNPDNRREIFPDEKLKKLLGYEEGSDPLTYYSMQTYMKSHFKSLPAGAAGLPSVAEEAAPAPKKVVVKSKGNKSAQKKA